MVVKGLTDDNNENKKAKRTQKVPQNENFNLNYKHCLKATQLQIK